MTWKGNLKKHTSKNPLIQWVMRRFYKDVLKTLKETGEPKTIIEAGCGEGFMSARMGETFPKAQLYSFDIEKEHTDYAKKHNRRKNVTYAVDDIFSFKKRAEVILCLEVMEHLEEYEKALAHLVKQAETHLILSVPREPWFRMANIARGKYLSDLGNTPGHVNNWTKGAFIKLVSKYATVESVKTSTIWTIVRLRV